MPNGQDAMEADSRTLTLTIDSPREVSIDMLARKLEAAQQVLFNIGSTIAGGGRRGPHSAKVLQECTLYFVKSEPGSLKIIAQLPNPSSLFEEMEVGDQSLTKMTQTLEAIEKKDRSAIEKLYSDSGQRTRVVKSVARLLPEEDAEYDVVVTTSKASNRLRSGFRESVEAVLVEPSEFPEQQVRTLTGILYLIEVVTGEHQVGVLARNRRIPCHYAADDEPLIRDLVPGSLVELKGVATLNDRGDIEQIEEIIDISMVLPIIPLNWSRVDYGNRRFVLKEQIQIKQDFSDDVWVCEFGPLGILAYGLSRREAVECFRRNFSVSWDDIAQEQDDNLTLDAQELKKKFRSLVEREESLA
jgi:hypothetical protein